MGVIEILTVLLVLLEIFDITTVSWFWILLPETLMVVIYFLFLFCALRVAGGKK